MGRRKGATRAVEREPNCTTCGCGEVEVHFAAGGGTCLTCLCYYRDPAAREREGTLLRELVEPKARRRCLQSGAPP